MGMSAIFGKLFGLPINAAEFDEGVHVGQALNRLVLLQDGEGGGQQGAGEADKALGPGPADGDVQAVEAVDKFGFGQGGFHIAHPIADDDALGLLPLHLVYRIHESRTVPPALFG